MESAEWILFIYLGFRCLQQKGSWWSPLNNNIIGSTALPTYPLSTLPSAILFSRIDMWKTNKKYTSHMHLEGADGKYIKISANGEEKKMDSILTPM